MLRTYTVGRGQKYLSWTAAFISTTVKLIRKVHRFTKGTLDAWQSGSWEKVFVAIYTSINTSTSTVWEARS
jgi:hypothetical protein